MVGAAPPLHTLAPAADVWPIGHAVCAVEPDIPTKKLTLAGIQDDCPAVGWKLPAAHGVCVVAPVVPTNDPAGASVHTVVPSVLLKAPNAHGVEELAPGMGTNRPNGACVHAAAPDVALKLPARHAVCVVAPIVPTKKPGAAGMHGVSPVAEKLPTVQATGAAVTVRLNGVALLLPALVTMRPARMLPEYTAAVALVMVTLKVHEPLAGMVKLVVVADNAAPGVAVGVAPTQVELAFGVGAFTRPGR